MKTQEQINKEVLGKLIAFLQQDLGMHTVIELLNELHTLDNIDKVDKL